MWMIINTVWIFNYVMATAETDVSSYCYVSFYLNLIKYESCGFIILEFIYFGCILKNTD